MERLAYALYADVLMNREVDTDNDILSVGGFTMTMKGKEVTFDFCLTAVTVDENDTKKIRIECEDPEYGYEQTSEISKEMMEEVTKISDFFIFTGEKDETDLVPLKLLSAAFYIPCDDQQIDIPDYVIKDAVLGTCVE